MFSNLVLSSCKGVQFLPYLLIFSEKNHGILAGKYADDECQYSG